jgi:hypothetical protein
MSSGVLTAGLAAVGKNRAFVRAKHHPLSADLMKLLRQRVADAGKSYCLLTDIIPFHRYNHIISFLRAV